VELFSRRTALLSVLALSRGLIVNPAAQVPSQRTAPGTGLLYDDVYLRHLAGNTGHPERPERLTAIHAGLERAGLLPALTPIPVRRVTDDELALVHTRAYIDLTRRELSNVIGLGELSTGDTAVTRDSLDAARAAAGGVLNAVDAVVAGRVRNAFCAVRPPGHHATPTRGMGFCIYNNVAVAARYLQRVSYLLRQGEPVADVALYAPTEEARHALETALMIEDAAMLTAATTPQDDVALVA